MSRDARQEALFPKLDQYLIDCLIPHGRTLELVDGEALFEEGVSSDTFYIVLDGQVKITKQMAGQTTVITVHDPGEFTGELSVLTRGPNLATGRALGSAKVLHVPFEKFTAAIYACPEMMTRVIPALAQRRPDAMVLQSQREKLASLGVLAAGLAHELNNPASAAARSASQLREAMGEQRQAAVNLCQLGLERGQLEALQAVLERLAERTPDEIDPLAKSDRETEIGERLEEMQVEDPWEVAAALVDAGVMPEEVAAITGDLPCLGVHGALQWLADSLTVQSLVQDIEQSAGRIGDLVRAIKSYSYMDQAPVQEIDVRTGIDSTLTMLGHKLRQKAIQVQKQYSPDTPCITAFAGELNQVWTNLIDNAVDALPEGGQIIIRTMAEGPCARIEIEDNGTGIPQEIQDRIFDPFFTTKDVGEGSGLGLDIAYKIVVEHHGGDLSLESQPGRTCFTVRLPKEQGEASRRLKVES
jgi:signal transduction histidine kinase